MNPLTRGSLFLCFHRSYQTPGAGAFAERQLRTDLAAFVQQLKYVDEHLVKVESFVKQVVFFGPLHL